MSWKETNPMLERVQFVAMASLKQRSMAGLCREFGISRKTGYKWLHRFETDGPHGVYEQSRAPLENYQETPEGIQEVLTSARKKHPTWGPRKLKAWLEDRNPGLGLPAASTIGEILKREGLVRARRRRQLPPGVTTRPIQVDRPNQEWDADFKGQFLLRNGEYCYPLTITDAHSRFLLEIRALGGTGTEGARRGFERAFREYGLPDSIRTDNGSPFASIGVGRLSSLSVWWIKLGIHPFTIRPGKPQENGRHERMHRTLKAETTRPPSTTARRQQDRFDAFREEFNHERPHEALGQKPPGRLYEASRRSYPATLAEPEYPSHFETRRVGPGGTFGWKWQMIWISKSLVGETIGLVEFAEGLWRVYFGSRELGILDEEDCRKRKTGRVLPMMPV